jgi:hypothetical protein
MFRNNKKFAAPSHGLKYGETEININFSVISEYLAVQLH